MGQYMKSKQLHFIEKFICLAILSVNSVYKFSEMYLSYSLNFTKPVYELVNLDVNKVCFEEEQDIPKRREKSKKIQNVTEWCICWKWDDVMHTNVEYLSCDEIEALGYVQLSDIRYDNRNVVTEKNSPATLLNLHLHEC